MSQRQLASVLFAVLGVFIAISRLPQVAMAIGIAAASDHATPAAYAITLLLDAIIAVLLGIVLVVIRVRLAERLFPADWPSVTQLVLGVGLFFGARGLARIWSAARSTG